MIRTVRVKKTCVRCDCIVEAPAPSRPIDRGIAGPGLLARILTGKYCEHLPLYRQTEIFARQGVELSRALLSNWVDACCRLMAPLDEALYHYVMDCRKLHTDDTPVPVLARAEKRRKPGASGRMCAMTGTLARQIRQQRGSRTHRIGREGIPSNIFAIIMEYLPSQGTTGCSAQSVTVIR